MKIRQATALAISPAPLIPMTSSANLICKFSFFCLDVAEPKPETRRQQTDPGCQVSAFEIPKSEFK
jgi:hypothetical protein